MRNSMQLISKFFVMFAVIMSVIAIGIAIYLKTMSKPSTPYSTPTPTQAPESSKDNKLKEYLETAYESISADIDKDSIEEKIMVMGSDGAAIGPVNQKLIVYKEGNDLYEYSFNNYEELNPEIEIKDIDNKNNKEIICFQGTGGSGAIVYISIFKFNKASGLERIFYNTDGSGAGIDNLKDLDNDRIDEIIINKQIFGPTMTHVESIIWPDIYKWSSDTNQYYLANDMFPEKYQNFIDESNKILAMPEHKDDTLVKEYLDKALNYQKSENQISDWKTYRNEEYGFEFKYPKNNSIVEVTSHSDWSETDGDLLVWVEKIVDIAPWPGGYSKKELIEERMALENNDSNIDESSVVNILGAFAIKNTDFTGVETCYVQFTRRVNIYKNDYLISLWLVYDKKDEIINNNPKYFTVDKVGCGDSIIWKFDEEAPDKFYDDLVLGRTDTVSQKWFNDFDKILSTFKFIEKDKNQ